MRYSIKDLEALGLVQNKDGSWSKPKIESPYIKQQKAVNDGLISREVVKETPDFQYALKTEWFIKGNIPAKKNSRINFVKNGKQISIPSKKHKEYVVSTKMQYEVFGREFRKAVEALGLPHPLRVEFTFFRGSKHAWDYSNILQTVEDCMKEKGAWIDDDNADIILPVFQPYVYDKANPGVKIRLLK